MCRPNVDSVRAVGTCTVIVDQNVNSVIQDLLVIRDQNVNLIQSNAHVYEFHMKRISIIHVI